MGYSFSTPCKSKRARDEMYAFIEEHYRAWDKVIEPYKSELATMQDNRVFLPFISFDTRLRGPRVEDLAYDHGKTKIGFDYGAGLSDGERYWLYNFCYWVAQRVGRRRLFKKKAKDCGAVPYVVYDGFEAWPVLEKSEYADKVGEESEWIVENGFRGMASRCDWEEQMQAERLERELGEASTDEDKEAILQSNEQMNEWLQGKRKGAEVVDKAITTELARLSQLWEARA